MPSGSRLLRAAALGSGGAPVAGATIILRHPVLADGVPRSDLSSSGADGAFAFAEPVPAGRYGIEFSKVGYRAGSLADFEVVAGRENRAELRITERSSESAEGGQQDPPPGVEVMTVHGNPASDLLGSIEKRQDADQLINLLSAR